MSSNSGTQATGGDGHPHNEDTAQDIWGAKNSLRRHAGLDRKQGDSEVTPLLASGSGSSTSGSTVREDGGAPQWEGHADFEGLSWRHKPSVSWSGPSARSGMAREWR